MVTFGDMMSLLLTFFVLLLSFSEVDAVKYRALSESLREAFGTQKGQVVLEYPDSKERQVGDEGQASGQLWDQLQSLVPEAFPGQIRKNQHNGGTILVVPGNVLFESGKAEIRPAMFGTLKSIAELIKEKPAVTLQVDGHTDDVPIKAACFGSNWDLSAARGIAVVTFMIEQGIPPGRLAAAAYADSRPLAANHTPGDRERNRRVEFRFVEEDGER